QVRRRAIRAGETILIPPGTVHALGGGALVFGVQIPGFAEPAPVGAAAGAATRPDEADTPDTRGAPAGVRTVQLERSHPAPGSPGYRSGWGAECAGEVVTPESLASVDATARALDGRDTAASPTLPNGRGLARWAGLQLERAGLLSPHVERYGGRTSAEGGGCA